MIERAFEIAKKLDKNKTPLKKFALAQALAILKGAHVADPKLEAEKHSRPKITKAKSAEKTPELILKAEWERQIKRLIELGFHTELKMTEDQYKDSMPEFSPQPSRYKGRFDIPLVVETRISLERQHKLAGIREFIDTDNVVNITSVRDKKPYTIWTHDANRYKGKSVVKARESFAKDEVGSPQFEVTALYLQYPEFFENHGVDAAGSSFVGGNAPYLLVFDGYPRVNAASVGSAAGPWGALSRGNVINLGA